MLCSLRIVTMPRIKLSTIDPPTIPNGMKHSFCKCEICSECNWLLLIHRSVIPYTRISVKVFNHNSLKKDNLIGETKLDLYETLKKHNGVISKLSLQLTLNLPQHHLTKSILSNRGPNYVCIYIDGLNVDMANYPQIDSNHQSSSSSNNPTSNNNFDTQAATSSTSNNNIVNVIAEITSSLPKWSLNDPFSAGASNGSGSSRNVTPDINKHHASPSRTVTPSSSQSMSQPSTSNGGTPAGQQNQRASSAAAPAAATVEEQLPPGWEIRYDTYGRYVNFMTYSHKYSQLAICSHFIGNTMLITIRNLPLGNVLFHFRLDGRCEKTTKVEFIMSITIRGWCDASIFEACVLWMFYWLALSRIGQPHGNDQHQNMSATISTGNHSRALSCSNVANGFFMKGRLMLMELLMEMDRVKRMPLPCPKDGRNESIRMDGFTLLTTRIRYTNSLFA